MEKGSLQYVNRELMERCRTLKEYSQFISCVRRHKETEQIEEAVDHAVTECIQKGILKKFLMEQRAEVVAMSIFEYDEEEEKRKLREAEFEYGREEGRREGRREGVREGELSTLTALVREGLLTVPEAAAHAGMSESGFEAELKKRLTES